MSATSTSVINDPRKASFVLEGVRLSVSRLGCVRASSNRAQLVNLQPRLDSSWARSVPFSCGKELFTQGGTTCQGISA